MSSKISGFSIRSTPEQVQTSTCLRKTIHESQDQDPKAKFGTKTTRARCPHSLTQSRPSQKNCYGQQGTWEKNSIIMVLNKIAQKPVHGTTIVPRDGQQSSMMNEKHVQKKPGVDHPILKADTFDTKHEWNTVTIAQKREARIKHVAQVQSCQQFGHCCEKCGPMGCSALVFLDCCSMYVLLPRCFGRL